MAAKENLINIVQFLLNYGADISRKDEVNKSLLKYSLCLIFVCHKVGKTALMISKEKCYNEITILLREAAAFEVEMNWVETSCIKISFRSSYKNNISISIFYFCYSEWLDPTATGCT